MATFVTTGSFEVPVEKTRLNGRRVYKPGLKDFWVDTGEFADQRGCYVFSMKAGKGERPWYVGKASMRALCKECFSTHKLNIYNDVLANRHGIPRITFVIPKRTKGAWPAVAIDEVEEFLIGHAASRNAELANKRRLPSQKWIIQGVVPRSIGAPSLEAASFKKLMGL
jgi:hypothetical protein